MNKNKVKVFKGFGFIEDPHTVSVTSGDVKEYLKARFILVATGSVPRDIPLFPTDGVRIINSDHALEMTPLPASIVIPSGWCRRRGICLRHDAVWRRNDPCRNAAARVAH
jgi:Pyruvate/2-oxoglutarate dehydrogenase complex, dihydrolipoamide dehydrogenase (E3) component, and related enzymes